MTAERDVARIVRSWLEEGATALPDRVLDQVLDQLPATHQRRATWPARRLSTMNSAMKMAIAAAAVVVFAIAGISLLPGVGIGPGAATPSPSASPSAAPLPSVGALKAGTYFIAPGEITPARVTFTVPAGWATGEGFVYKERGTAVAKPPPFSGPGELEVVTWIVTHAYTDSCHWAGTLHDAGTTVDELTNILKAQKGRVASTPTDAVLGGLPAKRIELTVPADLDVLTCDNGIVRFWPDPGPNENGGLCCSSVGSTDVVYVVDAAGQRFVVVARHPLDTSTTEQAELEGIVDSIRISVPPASPSPPVTSPSR